MGCAMWAYKAWQGRQLPERLSRDEQLPAYAGWCNAVEGNTTFYGLPSPTTVTAWAEQAPADFRFLFKLPRTVTHERRLRGVDDEVRAFLELLAPLGPRAETISVQLPASFGPPDLGALATFVRRLPAIDPGRHRIAVEVRHPAFFEESVARATLQRVLADEGCEWITLDADHAVRRAADERRRARRRGTRSRACPSTAKPCRHGRSCASSAVTIPTGRSPGGSRGSRSWRAGSARGAPRRSSCTRPTTSTRSVLARLFHEQVRAVVPDVEPLPVPAEIAPPTLF